MSGFYHHRIQVSLPPVTTARGMPDNPVGF